MRCFDAKHVDAGFDVRLRIRSRRQSRHQPLAQGADTELRMLCH